MTQEELDRLKEIVDEREQTIKAALEKRRKEDPITHALDLIGFARQIDAERAKKREGAKDNE